MHDLHHEKFVGNYGTVGVIDRLYGTHKVRDVKFSDEKTKGRAEKGVKFE